MQRFRGKHDKRDSGELGSNQNGATVRNEEGFANFYVHR